MAKLLYQGHGSYRITANDGRVIYVDPYAGEGYELPADIVLVSHQHGDHNKISLLTLKDGATVITNEEALEGGRHNSFTLNSIVIEAVEAGNSKHKPTECVGYIIMVDGVKIYASGDTSKTKQMESFAEKAIDYALLPCDGVYNMDMEEASSCAELIGAKHNIPIHMSPGKLFGRERAEKFTGANRLILEPGQEINL